MQGPPCECISIPLILNMLNAVTLSSKFPSQAHQKQCQRFVNLPDVFFLMYSPPAEQIIGEGCLWVCRTHMYLISSVLTMTHKKGASLQPCFLPLVVRTCPGQVCAAAYSAHVGVMLLTRIDHLKPYHGAVKGCDGHVLK